MGRRATYVIGNTLGINFLFITSKLFGKDYFDIDAGVAAIKRAQPKLVDFTGTAQKQLEQKEVVLAVLHDADTYDMQKRGIPVDWVAPQRGHADPRPGRPGPAGLEEQGAGVEVHRRLPLARGAAGLRHRALLEPDQQDGEGAPDVAQKIINGPADVDKLVLFDWAHGGQAAPPVDREVEQGDALTDRRPGASGTVTLTNLVKRYGATLALDGVSLAVAPGSSSPCSARPGAARPPRCARWRAS